MSTRAITPFRKARSPYWYVHIQVNGRRHIRSTGHTDRREAIKWAKSLRAQLILEATQQRKTAAAPLTVDQAGGRYWLEHAHKLRDADNVRRWLTYISKYMDASIPLSEMSNRHVHEFKQALVEAGRGPYSINRTLSALQGLHTMASKSWEEQTQAIDWGRFRNKERARIAWITEDEARDLLEHLSPSIRAVVHFLLATGLRKREAFDLTWDRVHADRITITAKGGIVRDVAIGPDAQQILAEQPRDGRYVFNTVGWRSQFQRARKLIGKPDLRWHDLRHTLATWLGRSGADLAVIQQQLGHSSIAVTNKYRHVIGSEVRDALDRLPRLTGASNVIPIRRREG